MMIVSVKPRRTTTKNRGGDDEVIEKSSIVTFVSEGEEDMMATIVTIRLVRETMTNRRNQSMRRNDDWKNDGTIDTINK